MKPTIADCIFDPESIDPIKAVPPPIKTNSKRLFSIFIPFKKKQEKKYHHKRYWNSC